MKTWNSIRVGTRFKTGAEIVGSKYDENKVKWIDDKKNGFFTARCACGNRFPVIFDPDCEGLQLCNDCFEKQFGMTIDEKLKEWEASRRCAERLELKRKWSRDRIEHGLPENITKEEKQNYERLRREYPRLWLSVLHHGEMILRGDEYYKHLTIPLFLLTEDGSKLNTGLFVSMLEDLIPQKCKDYEKDKALVLDKDKLNRDGRNLFVPGRISIIHVNENHKYRKVK